MNHRKKIISILGALIFGYFLSRTAAFNTPVLKPAIIDGVTTTSTIHVVRVIDGDTFETVIDGQKEKVRMLGIDTPESVDPRKPVQCFAKEASKKLAELILNKEIFLEPDQTNSDRDNYGRLLRYVVRAEDNLPINAEMIRGGYAHTYIKFPFERRAEYLKLQTEARDAGRGLWSVATCKGRP